MSSLRGAAFRLGTRLGHLQVIRWAVVGLEHVVRLAVKVVQWSAIAAAVVFGFVLVGFLIVRLNYAPLWLRVYNGCVAAQPEAISITEVFSHRSERMRLASSIAEEQIKLDQTPRGPKGSGR